MAGAILLNLFTVFMLLAYTAAVAWVMKFKSSYSELPAYTYLLKSGERVNLCKVALKGWECTLMDLFQDSIKDCGV